MHCISSERAGFHSMPSAWPHRWISVIMSGMAALAWNRIKLWASNLVETHPWALIEAAKQNNVDNLRVRL